MDTQELNQVLNNLFQEEDTRIVFWHDPGQEFTELVSSLDLVDVEILRLNEIGGLELKIRLEHEDSSQKFLLYSPTKEPDYEEDWLLDIRLYSRHFRADWASILLRELGLENQYLREHIAFRRKFFDNKERLAKLKGLVYPSDSPEDLDRKMIAVVVKSEQTEFFNILQTLFHQLVTRNNGEEINLTDSPVYNQIEKLDLAESFWGFAKDRFGYEEENPTLKNLLIQLMVSDFSLQLKNETPKALEHLILPQAGCVNAVVYLAQWRDSASQGSSYDVLSAEVARIIHLSDSLYNVSFEGLTRVSTFLEVEKVLISRLKDQIINTADTIDVDEIRSLTTKRQDGHWASLAIPPSDSTPRKALYSAYEACLTAAELFNLRNIHQDGFNYDTPKKMYSAYEKELFRFDQLYRWFCEAADEVKLHGWDVLKSLRERIESVYVNWYLVQSGLSWGKMLDPADGQGLIKYWKIEGKNRQNEFYNRFVQSQLDDSDRNRVFVIISDAFRYEAAEELTEALNGKYRFEAEITSQLGVLPSYTALGMASLLPHESLSYQPNGNILVDDKGAASLDQRNKILETRNGMACKAGELLSMKKDEGREFLSGKRVVYIYHNTVDAMGESHEESTIQAVRHCIDELSSLAGFLINSLNASYVLVTADHGFLFSETYPDEPEKSKLPDKPSGTVKAKRRYLLGMNLPDSEIAWKGSTKTTAGAEGGMDFWVPKGVNRFNFTGSKLFFHGGPMLQEIVVPVVTVRQVKGKSIAYTKIKTVSVQVLGSHHRITTNQYRFELLQMEAVSERVKPITLKVAVFEGDKPVTTIETVTFESTSGNMDERKRSVRLVLQNRQFDKNTPYRLILRDAETGVEQSGVDVIIDRAFTDDF